MARPKTGRDIEGKRHQKDVSKALGLYDILLSLLGDDRKILGRLIKISADREIDGTYGILPN